MLKVSRTAARLHYCHFIVWNCYAVCDPTCITTLRFFIWSPAWVPSCFCYLQIFTSFFSSNACRDTTPEFLFTQVLQSNPHGICRCWLSENGKVLCLDCTMVIGLGWVSSWHSLELKKWRQVPAEWFVNWERRAPSLFSLCLYYMCLFIQPIIVSRLWKPLTAPQLSMRVTWGSIVTAWKVWDSGALCVIYWFCANSVLWRVLILVT